MTSYIVRMRVCHGGIVGPGPWWQGKTYRCNGEALTEHSVKVLCTDPIHDKPDRSRKRLTVPKQHTVTD